jgi:hypothetical protein
MIYISTDEVVRLKKEVLPVLMALFSRLEDGNRVVFSTLELAKKHDVPRIYVANAIRHLVRIGAMSRGTKEGDRRSYQMSPNLVWKGTTEAHELALGRYDRMKAAGIKGVLSTSRLLKTKAPASASASLPHLQEVIYPPD